ncbi:UNKNOWN [Stylonychia lemnae]|uniref:Uncharacterized protein n=1 Tax=Stylonychia lemnae TaxID=5949 RepID=A0A078AYW7_STYLE|nr:UNKNOWN [Stylonychia lemnae]|eukprot:CDW86377.1 UNKNOWN [Stylonychia lemnae]
MSTQSEQNSQNLQQSDSNMNEETKSYLEENHKQSNYQSQDRMEMDQSSNHNSQQQLDSSNHQSQNSELNQESADSVNSLPYEKKDNGGADLKVIESKTICYCSNFDLNINEWFNEYENIEIFKINMKKNLGATWLKYFNEAIEFPATSVKKVKEDHFFTRIFNFYLINYYSPANASAFKMTRNYKLRDKNLFKSLIHTFYFVSLKEYENILKKIESDQKYQIQLTEKALAQYDEQQRREALNQREQLLQQQRQSLHDKNKKANGEGQSSTQSSIFGNNFPGFSIIKDRVIKPLLIATEKVVEYYFPEEKKESSRKDSNQSSGNQTTLKNQQRSSAGGTTKTTFDDSMSEESNDISRIKRKMKKLDINSVDDAISTRLKLESPKSQRTLKKRRFRQLERHNFDSELDPFEHFDSASKSSTKGKNDRKVMKLNEKMLRKASATVDLISQKVKSKNMIQESVSATFVTNVIELTNDALEKISQNEKALLINEADLDQTYNVNLRFIKPSHNFYNEVMSNWFKYLYIIEEQRENLPQNQQWNASELVKGFIGFSIQLMKNSGSWQEQVIRPLEYYAHIIIKEFCLLKNHSSESQEDGSTSNISMCSFFDNVKSNLLKRWEKDIIQKSSKFQNGKQTMQ